MTKRFCPHCAEEIDTGGVRCPHCEGSLRRPGRWVKFGIIGAVVAAAPVVYAAGAVRTCPWGASLVGAAPPDGLLAKCQREDAEGNLVNHGAYREWYPSGQLRAETSFKDGRIDGRIRTWHPDGTLALVGEFHDGVQSGEWKQWYANGQQAGRGEWRDGKRHGHWSAWHPNGSKMFEFDANDGIQGTVHFWYRTGEEDAEIAFKDDLPDGAYRRWWIDSPEHRLEREGTFAKGKKIGAWKTWWPTGGRRVEATIGADGSVKGAAYDEYNGKLLSTYECRDGLVDESTCRSPSFDFCAIMHGPDTDPCAAKGGEWPIHHVPSMFFGNIEE